MKRTAIKRAAVFLLAAVFIMMLTGCDVETHRKNNQYVSDVKNLVNDSVNLTRKLKQQSEELDCKDAEKVRGYLLAADDLINTLQQIQKLRPTNEFDEMDERLKTASEAALNNISQIRSFVAYARDSGDDTIFKRESDSYYTLYLESYDKMKQLSSEIQTYWRNA